MNAHCYELSNEMLFDSDIRYDELLNAFDVLVSDYSSIVFDYLILDRPVVYLIPDYEEYSEKKGFVFNNIDAFMPGDKTFSFDEFLTGLNEALKKPEKYKKQREFVLDYRFDFRDDNAARRCFNTIINYKIPDKKEEHKAEYLIPDIPTAAQMLKPYISDEYVLIDSSRAIPDNLSPEKATADYKRTYLYITEEKPDEYRRLSGHSATEIYDIESYYGFVKCINVKPVIVEGGVDFDFFNFPNISVNNNKRPRIGFAGIIDVRIYFAMIQCICDALGFCDIILAGQIYGTYPEWLDSFENLYYIETSYDKIPDMIYSFDVALLPFYDRFQNKIPSELFWYLACGKQVVASDMKRLPKCKAIYKSISISDAIANVKRALEHKDDLEIKEAAVDTAKGYDWKNIAGYLMRRL